MFGLNKLKKDVEYLKTELLRSKIKERGNFLFNCKCDRNEIIDIRMSTYYSDRENRRIGSMYYDYNTSWTNIDTKINLDKALELYQDEGKMFFHTLEEAEKYWDALLKVKKKFRGI